MATHVLSEYSDYEIFLELNHIPDPYPFEKIEHIPRERVTQTNTRNPKPQAPIKSLPTKKVDFQSQLPLRPITEKQTEYLDETTMEDLDPKFDPSEKFKNFFQNSNKLSPLEDPTVDNPTHDKFKKFFTPSSKLTYSQPDGIENSKISALAMKYLQGPKPYRPESLYGTPQLAEGFSQPNNIAINRTLSSDSNNSSTLPPNNLALSKNTSFESTGSSKATAQTNVPVQKQGKENNNSFEDTQKSNSFSSQNDPKTLKSAYSTDDAKKLSPPKQTPPTNTPSQTEVMLINELQLMTNKVEEMRLENEKIRKEKDVLLSEHKLRVNEAIAETKAACEKETSEKLKKLEAEKEAISKEVFQLKQEKLLAERQSISLRQQVLDFDSVNAKLEACTAEKNYFETELKKTKLAKLQVEEELNKKMEESMIMMAEYEKKIKSMQKQLEAMNLLKESDMTMANMKNDNNESFLSEVTLDFDSSPFKKNPGQINWAVGENKYN